MIDYTSPEFWPKLFSTLAQATGETLFMVFVAMLFTLLIGLPLGILVVGTEKGRFLEAPLGQRWLGAAIHHVLTFIVNFGRSVPFIVLVIALIPVTQFFFGKFIGTGPATFPLTIIAIPFFVRIVEIALREVDPGLLEAAEAMGASRWQTVRRVLLPQATPAIILGIATTLTSIINFSAMVGIVGGGGLGQVAVTYGQQRYSWVHIVFVVAILFVLVQLIQFACSWLAKRYGMPRPGVRMRRGRLEPQPAPEPDPDHEVARQQLAADTPGR